MEECCCSFYMLAYMVKAVVVSYALQFPTFKYSDSVPGKTSFLKTTAFTNYGSVGYVHIEMF